MPKEPDSHVHNRLAALRQERGLSVSALAQAVGVTRQAVYAMETGTYVPNTAIALRLARTLQTKVEHLFALEEDATGAFRTEHVDVIHEPGSHSGQTVQIASVGQRLVATAPSPVAWYIPVADGVLTKDTSQAQIFDPDQTFDKRIVIAGCDPGISVLGRHLLRAGVELVMVHRNSVASLSLLDREMIHIAGTHLRDQNTGEANLPAIRELVNSDEAAVVSYAVWEQGICTPKGNPKSIKSVEDFARADVEIVNREVGAGTRAFLTGELDRLGISPENVRGYTRIVDGHLQSAWHVSSGRADACIATAAAARAFGLHFQPLTAERYDLALSTSILKNPLIEIVLDTLNRAAFRRELETLGGYDTSVSGRRVL